MFFLRFKNKSARKTPKERYNDCHYTICYAVDLIHKMDISLKRTTCLSSIILTSSIFCILVYLYWTKYVLQKGKILQNTNMKFPGRNVNRVSCWNHIKVLPTVIVKIYNFRTSYIIYYPNFFQVCFFFLL